MLTGVVALTGSTKFKEDFERVAKELALKGKVVLLPVIYSHTDKIELTDKQVNMLEQENIQKMRIADELLVINKGGYIGEGLRRELSPFIGSNKPIKFMEPLGKLKVKSKVLDLLRISDCEKEGILEIYGILKNNYILKNDTYLPKEFFSEELRVL